MQAFAGNVVAILNEGARPVCCGDPMTCWKKRPRVAATESTLPYVKNRRAAVLGCNVGKETAHPMEEKHYIKFIEVLTAEKVCRAELKPGMSPRRSSPCRRPNIVKAREWCNVMVSGNKLTR
jgi:superoxide reductase